VQTLDALIAEHTADIAPVQFDYTSRLPNAELIAAACAEDEVEQLLGTVERLARERDAADRAGTANGDDLDFMWDRMARYASPLPHLVPRFLPVIEKGLRSDRDELRLFIAQALKISPSPDAIASLEAALVIEDVKPVRGLLTEALAACKSKRSWLKRLFS